MILTLTVRNQLTATNQTTFCLTYCAFREEKKMCLAPTKWTPELRDQEEFNIAVIC